MLFPGEIITLMTVNLPMRVRMITPTAAVENMPVQHWIIVVILVGGMGIGEVELGPPGVDLEMTLMSREVSERNQEFEGLEIVLMIMLRQEITEDLIENKARGGNQKELLPRQGEGVLILLVRLTDQNGIDSEEDLILPFCQTDQLEKIERKEDNRLPQESLLKEDTMKFMQGSRFLSPLTCSTILLRRPREWSVLHLMSTLKKRAQVHSENIAWQREEILQDHHLKPDV